MKKLIIALLMITFIFSCKNNGMQDYIVEITEKEFLANVYDFKENEMFAEDKNIYVYLYSDASPSCSACLPYIEKVASKFYKKIDFYKINLVTTSSMLEVFDVHVAPASILIKKGVATKKFKKIFGVVGDEDIEKIIKQEFDL